MKGGKNGLENRIDPTVIKETQFIAGIELAFSAVMQIVYLLLGKWNVTVLLGNLLGGTLAVGNFFLMGLTVAKSIGLTEKEAKKKLQSSQQLRLMMMLVVLVIGGALSCFDTIAVLIPQLFPRIGVSIRGLTLKDK